MPLIAAPWAPSAALPELVASASPEVTGWLPAACEAAALDSLVAELAAGFADEAAEPAWLVEELAAEDAELPAELAADNEELDAELLAELAALEDPLVTGATELDGWELEVTELAGCEPDPGVAELAGCEPDPGVAELAGCEPDPGVAELAGWLSDPDVDGWLPEVEPPCEGPFPLTWIVVVRWAIEPSGK